MKIQNLAIALSFDGCLLFNSAINLATMDVGPTGSTATM